MRQKIERQPFFGRCTAADIAHIGAGMLFIVLAGYIALFLDLPAGIQKKDVYPMAFLTAAYGLWRLWNSVVTCRRRRTTGRTDAERRGS